MANPTIPPTLHPKVEIIGCMSKVSKRFRNLNRIDYIYKEFKITRI